MSSKKKEKEKDKKKKGGRKGLLDSDDEDEKKVADEKKTPGPATKPGGTPEPPAAAPDEKKPVQQDEKGLAPAENGTEAPMATDDVDEAVTGPAGTIMCPIDIVVFCLCPPKEPDKMTIKGHFSGSKKAHQFNLRALPDSRSYFHVRINVPLDSEFAFLVYNDGNQENGPSHSHGWMRYKSPDPPRFVKGGTASIHCYALPDCWDAKYFAHSEAQLNDHGALAMAILHCAPLLLTPADYACLLDTAIPNLARLFAGAPRDMVPLNQLWDGFHTMGLTDAEAAQRVLLFAQKLRVVFKKQDIKFSLKISHEQLFAALAPDGVCFTDFYDLCSIQGTPRFNHLVQFILLRASPGEKQNEAANQFRRTVAQPVQGLLECRFTEQELGLFRRFQDSQTLHLEKLCCTIGMARQLETCFDKETVSKVVSELVKDLCLARRDVYGTILPKLTLETYALQFPPTT